jgi:hypothetical protein
MGAGAVVTGYVKALTTVTTGADSLVCGNIDAMTVTLGAGAGTAGNLTATTATTGAGAFVDGNLAATTATLGAGACYGGSTRGFTTLTLGAGAVASCPSVATRPACLAPTHSSDGHGNGTLDGSDHHEVDGVGTAHTH